MIETYVLCIQLMILFQVQLFIQFLHAMTLIVDLVVDHHLVEAVDDSLVDEVVEDDDEEGARDLFGEPMDDDDPLYDQALEIVVQSGKASASYIQRRLKIEYVCLACGGEFAKAQAAADGSRKFWMLLLVGGAHCTRNRENCRLANAAGRQILKRPFEADRRNGEALIVNKRV